MSCCIEEKPEAVAPVAGRRRFVQLAALASGVSLLGTPLSSAHAAGATEAMLLSCMDFRLMDEIDRYMHSRGLRDKYDHVVLAGASLGAVTDKYPAWSKTFWEHLDIAIQLHAIQKVIILDHRDCGAYKVILGEAHAKTPQAELAAHAEQLGKLRRMIEQKHPKLAVETLLMSLDGKVQAVDTATVAG